MIKHGMTKTRLFRIWTGLFDRCDNPKDTSYPYYGGRGITICDEWRNGFETFRDWALKSGYKDDLTLDRIEGDKGYSPDNCRWTTRKEQSNNLRNNRSLTFNGETHTMSEWAEITGISRDAIQKRLDRLGWSLEDALTISVSRSNRRYSSGRYKNAKNPAIT